MRGRAGWGTVDLRHRGRGVLDRPAARTGRERSRRADRGPAAHRELVGRADGGRGIGAAEHPGAGGLGVRQGPDPDFAEGDFLLGRGEGPACTVRLDVFLARGSGAGDDRAEGVGLGLVADAGVGFGLGFGLGVPTGGVEVRVDGGEATPAAYTVEPAGAWGVGLVGATFGAEEAEVNYEEDGDEDDAPDHTPGDRAFVDRG